MQGLHGLLGRLRVLVSGAGFSPQDAAEGVCGWRALMRGAPGVARMDLPGV